MAVGVAEAQVTVVSKELIGNSRALYIGTIAFGTEYATGGDTIGNIAEPRYKLPAFLDWISVQGPYTFQFVAPNLIKVYWPEKEKVKLLELAAKTDLSAQTALPFFAIGIA